jgi:hypothetical protein
MPRHLCEDIIFGDTHRLDGRVDGLVAGRRSLRASYMGTKVERVVFTIYGDEYRQHGATRSRRQTRMLDARRVVAPSGVMASSTSCLARSMH